MHIQFHTLRFLVLFFLITFCVSLIAMIDNRFRDPVLNHHTFVHIDAETCNNILTIQPFVEFAHHSVNQYSQEVPFFDYDGMPFLLGKLNQAVMQAGLSQTSLIPSYWQAPLAVGPLDMTGKFNTKGLAFHWFCQKIDCWGAGIRGDLFKAETHMELIRRHNFENIINGPGDVNELLSVIQNIDSALQLHSRSWEAVILDDFELYVKYFHRDRYCYKCRLVDAGVALGLIVPAAPGRDINNPASLSLGGNGHWGGFVDMTVDAVLRYDLDAGVWMRFQQRFPGTNLLRVPTAQEPEMFGAVVGNFRVNPGFTFFLSPYIIKEGLREGFGLRLGYTLVKHFRDTFTDERSDKSVPVNLTALSDNSEWGKDYVTLGFIYDFAYGKVERRFEPIVSLILDAPVNFLAAQRSARTYGISFVMETSF